jgi:WD40 repeat protein
MRVKIWDAASGKLLQTLERHQSNIGTVRWSPDGRWLLSADWSRHVFIWNANTWTVQWDLIHPVDASSGGNDGSSYSSDWSPDSRRIVTRSGAGNLVVWDFTDGQTPRQAWSRFAHTTNIRSIAWSPDGRRIASGSVDSTVKIWDAATGRELLAFDLNRAIELLAWSPDSAQLAISPAGGGVRILDARKALAIDWDATQVRRKPAGDDVAQ